MYGNSAINHRYVYKICRMLKANRNFPKNKGIHLFGSQKTLLFCVCLLVIITCLGTSFTRSILAGETESMDRILSKEMWCTSSPRHIPGYGWQIIYQLFKALVIFSSYHLHIFTSGKWFVDGKWFTTKE